MEKYNILPSSRHASTPSSHLPKSPTPPIQSSPSTSFQTSKSAAPPQKSPTHDVNNRIAFEAATPFSPSLPEAGTSSPPMAASPIPEELSAPSSFTVEGPPPLEVSPEGSPPEVTTERQQQRQYQQRQRRQQHQFPSTSSSPPSSASHSNLFSNFSVISFNQENYQDKNDSSNLSHQNFPEKSEPPFQNNNSGNQGY